MLRNYRSLLAVAFVLPQPAWAQADAQDASTQGQWISILYLLLVVLVAAVALFIWFQRRQKRKGED